MRKYIPLVLFIFSWPVLSADVHGQIYAPDRMNVSKRKLTAVCSHQTRIGNLDAHLI